MASSEAVKEVIRLVKPLLSSNRQEARRRVLNLYKTWYKDLPYMIFEHSLPYNLDEVRQKLRSEFLKHKHVTDIRMIDMLVLKGQMQYQEIKLKFKPRCQILYWFKETELPKPKDFMSKFLSGTD